MKLNVGHAPGVAHAPSRVRLVVAALLFLFWTLPALSQGCAMCYSNAAGTTKDGQRAISRAVIVLLLPPVGFMTVGLGLALHYGRKRDRDIERGSSPSAEVTRHESGIE